MAFRHFHAVVLVVALSSLGHAQSTAEKIAAVDGHAYSVSRIQQLLDHLTGRYGVSEREIGDMTQGAKNALSDRGIEESDTSIMSAADALNMHGHSGHDLYAMVLTQYIEDRAHGYSHERSITHLRMCFDAADTLTRPHHKQSHRRSHKKKRRSS